MTGNDGLARPCGASIETFAWEVNRSFIPREDESNFVILKCIHRVKETYTRAVVSNPASCHTPADTDTDTALEEWRSLMRSLEIFFDPDQVAEIVNVLLVIVDIVKDPSPVDFDFVLADKAFGFTRGMFEHVRQEHWPKLAASAYERLFNVSPMRVSVSAQLTLPSLLSQLIMARVNSDLANIGDALFETYSRQFGSPRLS